MNETSSFGSAANMQTVDDVLTQVLSQVLNSVPGLNIFQKQIRDLVYDQLGLAGKDYRDTFLDTVLTSNMTPYGMATELTNRRIEQIAADATKHRALAARPGLFADIGRTLMSFESGKDIKRSQNVAEESLTRENYEDFINNEAAGRASNFLWNMVYNTVDPDGLGAASKHLAEAGANQIRHGRWAGRRGAFLEARAVGDLFTGKDGKYDFNKADYGYMSIGEASAVTAAITKDIDFFRTMDGKKPDDFKQAAEKLRKTVQDYTKALSPLKDLFGSDVPAMITAIEDLAGQKLSQLDPVHMGDLVRRVMAGATAGNYSLGQLQGQREAITSGLLKMAVPYINDVSALSQATTILGMTMPGPGPSFMSKERFDQMAGELVVRSSASSGATAINQAYAMWRERQTEDDIKGLSKEEVYQKFVNEYETLRKNYTADEALLKISNQNSMYNLEVAATGSRYYREAVESNLGGYQAVRENRQRYIDTAKTRAINEQHGAAFDEAIAAIENNVALLSDTEQLVEAKGISAEAKAEILRIGNGHYGADLSMSLVAYDQAEKSRIRTERQIKAMKSAEIMRAIPANGIELVRDFLAGKELPSTEWTKDLKTLLPEDKEMLRYSLNAASMLADVYFKKDEDEARTEEDRKRVKQERDRFEEAFVTYSLNNGPTNALFTQKQMEFEDLMRRAENPGEGESASDLREQAKQVAGLMDLYRYSDESLVTQWMEGATEEQRKEKEQAMRQKLLKPGSETELISSQLAGQEINDMIRVDFIEKGMRARGMNEDYIKTAMAGIRNMGEELGPLALSRVKEFLQKDETLKKLSTEENTDAALMTANEAFGKSMSLETVLFENSNLISKLLSKLEEYFDTEAKRNASGSTAPAPGNN